MWILEKCYMYVIRFQCSPFEHNLKQCPTYDIDSFLLSRALQNARLELRKSKRKDYYKILGVGRDASEEEIKKAYRKRALVHHPG